MKAIISFLHLPAHQTHQRKNEKHRFFIEIESALASPVHFKNFPTWFKCTPRSGSHCPSISRIEEKRIFSDGYDGRKGSVAQLHSTALGSGPRFQAGTGRESQLTWESIFFICEDLGRDAPLGPSTSVITMRLFCLLIIWWKTNKQTKHCKK